jgi:hypothetical protein
MPLSSTELAQDGLAIRTAAVVVYIAWVVAGLCLLHSKQTDPNQLRYIATRDLPAGHRLHAGDFAFDPPVPAGERSQLPPWSVPVGKYVIDRRLANEPIAQSDLSSVPVIKVGKDKQGKDMVPYWFSLRQQAALANVLNTDSRVDICSGLCFAQNVRVVSIVCSGATPSDCYAALELSAESGTNLAPVAKDYRLILRSDSTR